MKWIYLLAAICLFAALNGCTQEKDDTRWGLPKGAKLRIGRGRVEDVKFSPDGKLLAVASSVGIWLYDTETYTPRTLITADKGAVTAIAFSADSRHLAGGSGHYTLSVWDVRSGRLLRTFGLEKGLPPGIGDIVGGLEEVVFLAFSPDGRSLASFARFEGTLRLWNAHTGDLLKTFFKDYPSELTKAAAFSQDGQTLAIADGDGGHGRISLWDAETHRYRNTILTKAVISMAFSPDGRTLAAVVGRYDDDKALLVWNMHTRKWLRTLTGHTGSIDTLAFSLNNRIVAGGDDGDRVLRMWDARTGDLLRTFKGHTDFVRVLAFSPSGETLVSASFDNTLRVWDTETGQQKRVLMEHIGWGKGVVFSPDGRWLASISYDDKIRLWDRHTGHLLRVLSGHTGPVTAVAVSSDGRTLASIGRFPDRTLRLWNPETGELLKTVSEYVGKRTCVFSPDSQTLATGGGREGTVRLFDVATGRLLKTLVDSKNIVKTVAFSPDGKLLAGGGWSTGFCIWDVQTGDLLKTFSEAYGVEILAFSPNGKTLASGGGFKDATIRLWDIRTGEKRFTLKGHEKNPTTAHVSDVYAIAFSPDGMLLASGGIDGTVRLWDPTTGSALSTFVGNQSSVSAVAFSPDGKTLASGESAIFLWDVDAVLRRIVD